MTRIFFLVVIILGIASETLAQLEEPTLVVAGAIENRRIGITSADLAKLPRHTVTIKNENGTSTFEGVTVQSVLELAGVRFGKTLTGARLLTFVVIEGVPPSIRQLMANDHAGEDYQALFALPELDTTFTDQPLLLATSRDGKPLVAPDGPIRVIVSQDKRDNRWVKSVKTIWIVNADSILR